MEEFTGGGKRISRLICAIDLIEVNAKRRRSRKDRVARFSLDPAGKFEIEPWADVCLEIYGLFARISEDL